MLADIIEEEGFITCTAARHQGAIEMSCPRVFMPSTGNHRELQLHFYSKVERNNIVVLLVYTTKIKHLQ